MFPPQLFTHSASAVVTGLYLQCSVFLSTTPRDDSLLIFIFFSHVPYSRSSPAYYRAPSTCPQSRIQCVISCLLGNTHGNFSLPTPLNPHPSWPGSAAYHRPSTFCFCQPTSPPLSTSILLFSLQYLFSPYPRLCVLHLGPTCETISALFFSLFIKI